MDEQTDGPATTPNGFWLLNPSFSTAIPPLASYPVILLLIVMVLPPV